MKFERKYPQSDLIQRFEFGDSYITKSPKLGNCALCGSMTRWFDVNFQTSVCSEECLHQMWESFKESGIHQDKFQIRNENIKRECLLISQMNDVPKDVIIVVHDQLDYFRHCIDSLKSNTKMVNLHLWDNASNQATQDYIQSLHQNGSLPSDWTIVSIRSEKNTGFIYPNNELASLGTSDYIILLNSDTKVFLGWDLLLMGMLKENPDIGITGAWGGYLGPDGRGFGGSNGYDIDYISGWCLCMGRSDYEKHGLFNKQLKFAYCEDADLSLRIKESGKKIYAMWSPLVHHYQNKTISAVQQEGEFDVLASFNYNHEYLRTKWANYLENDRVLLKIKEK